MNKKTKILQFPIANSYGGITHYALNNWYHMDKTRFQCDFATMSKHLDFEDEILETGSKIHYISCYAETDKEQFCKEFLKILVEGQYDVVHLHTKQWKSFLVEELCKQVGVPKVIVHSHSTRCDNNDEEIRREETEQHYKVRSQIDESIATDFWACSKSAAGWLFGDRIPENKIKIMNNAIETERFIFDEKIRKEKRLEFGFMDTDFVIGNVGRLCYQKNQKFLIEAFANAFPDNINTKLLIIGEGELRDELEALADELQVGDRVVFAGKRTDVNELYQAMDLFVLPSNFEGLPISVIEAVAAGLYCLVADTITNEIRVTDDVSMLPLDTDIWGHSIRKSMTNQSPRKNMENIIKEIGYNMNDQISIIENAYISKRKTGVIPYCISARVYTHKCWIRTWSTSLELRRCA